MAVMTISCENKSKGVEFDYLPVKLVGVGEKMEDLKDFDSKEFIQALFD